MEHLENRAERRGERRYVEMGHLAIKANDVIASRKRKSVFVDKGDKIKLLQSVISKGMWADDVGIEIPTQTIVTVVAVSEISGSGNMLVSTDEGVEASIPRSGVGTLWENIASRKRAVSDLAPAYEAAKSLLLDDGWDLDEVLDALGEDTDMQNTEIDASRHRAEIG